MPNFEILLNITFFLGGKGGGCSAVHGSTASNKIISHINHASMIQIYYQIYSKYHLFVVPQVLNPCPLDLIGLSYIIGR